MKAIFLCGGVGKRMFPVTWDKFLLQFLGKTLLEHQIEQVKRAGLDNFILVGNSHNIARIKEVAENITDARFSFAVQEKPTGMAGALKAASDLITGEPILVVNPDDVVDSEAYTRIITECQGGSATSCMLAYETQTYFPGGYLVLNKNNEITSIVEKPGKGKEPSRLVNVVVHLHTQPQKLLEHIAAIKNTSDDIYEQALTRMIEHGDSIRAVKYTGSWQAIKYPWDILSVMDYFLGKVSSDIATSASIAPSATIEDNVIIAGGARIMENAVVRGPCYIGHNSIIGNDTLVRGGSHIGDDCVVGHATEIKHSYIGDGCWFHQNYCGDSVVGYHCSFGAGTVTGNLRLDDRNITVMVGKEIVDTNTNKLGSLIGNNVRTGINVSIMPGVRIGANSFVGPHVCLDNDLPENRMARAVTPGYEVVDSTAISEKR